MRPSTMVKNSIQLNHSIRQGLILRQTIAKNSKLTILIEIKAYSTDELSLANDSKTLLADSTKLI